MSPPLDEALHAIAAKLTASKPARTLSRAPTSVTRMRRALVAHASRRALIRLMGRGMDRS
jgi:hypothetical protein